MTNLVSQNPLVKERIKNDLEIGGKLYVLTENDKVILIGDLSSAPQVTEKTPVVTAKKRGRKSKSELASGVSTPFPVVSPRTDVVNQAA